MIYQSPTYEARNQLFSHEHYEIIDRSYYDVDLKIFIPVLHQFVDKYPNVITTNSNMPAPLKEMISHARLVDASKEIVGLWWIYGNQTTRLGGIISYVYDNVTVVELDITVFVNPFASRALIALDKGV
jgi:hypothetical protein